MSDTIQNQLKKIKVDMLYGKKKHFNAADRKSSYHYFIGVPLIILNILTTSVLFYVLTDGVIDWVKYIPIGLTLIAALLGGFQTYLNFQKSAEAHRRIGNKYLSVLKKCDRLQGYLSESIISNQKAVTLLERIASNVDEINKDSESYPTSNGDYLKAKAGIKSGEEHYTEEELNI